MAALNGLGFVYFNGADGTPGKEQCHLRYPLKLLKRSIDTAYMLTQHSQQDLGSGLL